MHRKFHKVEHVIFETRLQMDIYTSIDIHACIPANRNAYCNTSYPYGDETTLATSHN